MSDADREAEVVIVGGGPAGLSAATELRRNGVGRVIVLERDAEAGGVPRHCGHSPYGFREFRRPMLGPAYASALAARASQAGVEIRTDVSVTAIREGPRLEIAGDAGRAELPARVVLLATGTRESTRAGRLIGGTKPGGVMTTGALQGFVYGAGMRPFRRPVILGSELVAFSAVLTCRHAGIRPVGMVEPGMRATARFPAALLPRLLGIPLLLSTDLLSIEGRDRVEAVIVRSDGIVRRIEADGLVTTGGFRPEATLVRESHLALDPNTGGPEIDEFGRTSDPAIFAAGNVLRPVETAGWCWEEGRRVARAIARALRDELPAAPGARVAVTGALRYAVPQRISGGAAPAFDRLQIRAARAVHGRLSLRADGHEVAGRTFGALPERRLSLPLPPLGSAAEVALYGSP